MCWTKFKTIGHSSKNLSPSQKTLRPTWCPKLVTELGLYCVKRIMSKSVEVLPQFEKSIVGVRL